MYAKKIASSKMRWFLSNIEHQTLSLKNLTFSHYLQNHLSPLTHNLQSLLNLSTTPSARGVHTIKGWKKMALKEDKDSIKSEERLSIACEEGKEAIPHTVLMSKLQNCNSVSSQIETFCSTLSLTSEEIARRKAFVQSLNDLFKMFFSRCETNLFGSSMNSLGFKGCDADVCLRTNFTDQETLMLNDVPKLEEVLDGTITQDTLSRMNSNFLLRFVRRIIRRQSTDIKEPILFIKARCPLLRFYSSKYDVFCDFSFESGLSIQNTRLLLLLSKLDKRFTALSQIVRYWGKHGGFIGDIDMFNSYSSSLLVAHFFQMTNPPIFPSIKEIYSKSEYLRNGPTENDEALLRDLEKFSPSNNLKTSEELLRDFFFYFLCFDYSRVMLPFIKSSIPKANFGPLKSDGDTFEFGAINLQDPFRPSFNATFGSNFKNGKRFLNGIINSCKVYQDHSTWIPKAEPWGLCNLFLSPLSEAAITKEWQESIHHIIELTPKPNITTKLKQILEHGLMFQCTELNTKDAELLRLKCKAYHNTWQGRDQVLEDIVPTTDLDTLNKEHLVSTELIKSKSGDRRTVLSEFDCDCREVELSGEKKIEVILKFRESKFPPIVALFLKDYIPSILNKL